MLIHYSRWLLRGKTAKQIADYLAISHRTVEQHIANCKQKLGCHSKAELIAYCIANGWINLMPSWLVVGEIN